MYEFSVVFGAGLAPKVSCVSWCTPAIGREAKYDYLLKSDVSAVPKSLFFSELIWVSTRVSSLDLMYMSSVGSFSAEYFCRGSTKSGKALCYVFSIEEGPVMVEWVTLASLRWSKTTGCSTFWGGRLPLRFEELERERLSCGGLIP